MKQYLYRALAAAVMICAVTQASASSPGVQPGQETLDNGTTHALEEVIITASRQESKVFNSSLPVNVVTREAIEKIAPTGMGDLFEHLPGLNVSHTSMGSVRPMIRGLYDERVLIMVDGIRLSEQRGGGDHALSINPGQIERIEVVRGPGSVLYGAGVKSGHRDAEQARARVQAAAVVRHDHQIRTICDRGQGRDSRLDEHDHLLGLPSRRRDSTDDCGATP